MIGILALQGDFLEHQHSLERLGCSTKLVRTVADAKQTKGLVLPGGESTTIGKLLRSTQLDQWIIAAAHKGYPLYGTCAGCILLAKRVDSPYSLKLIDITVKRNAYGRQLDSFEIILSSKQLPSVPAYFIRAPKIETVGKNVTILLAHHSDPVLVQQNNILAGTFHPELSNDLAVHHYFVKMIKN